MRPRGACLGLKTPCVGYNADSTRHAPLMTCLSAGAFFKGESPSRGLRPRAAVIYDPLCPVVPAPVTHCSKSGIRARGTNPGRLRFAPFIAVRDLAEIYNRTLVRVNGSIT